MILRIQCNISHKYLKFVIYSVMNDYIREYCGSRTVVAPPSLRKHASPTKRLISLKNTTFSHKKVMHDNMQQVRDHSSYQLTYSTSPGKTYVIEPHGGELNYKLVDRHPERFYHQVFNQDITQTKFRESPRRMVEISTKVTKRPYMKIMEKIRTKIADRLKEKFGEQAGEAILEALREKHIEHQIVLLLRQDRIQLLNQHNQPIYVKQIQHALDHHAALDRGTSHLLQAPNDVTYDGGSDAEGAGSTYNGQASRSKLEMQERDLQHIEGEVREHLIKQNSLQ